MLRLVQLIKNCKSYRPNNNFSLDSKIHRSNAKLCKKKIINLIINLSSLDFIIMSTKIWKFTERMSPTPLLKKVLKATTQHTPHLQLKDQSTVSKKYKLITKNH